MSGRLAGKVAVVTGAASGIGRATSLRFAVEGAAVVLADKNAEAGEEVANEVGDPALFAPLDVTSPEAWDGVIAAVERKFGALHILVNSAGISPHDTIEDANLEVWRRIQAVNVESVFLGCQRALPLVVRSGGGSIVNLSSVAGIRGGPDYASYGVSKAGVRNLTKSIALHCARQGYNVRCNSIHPGSIDTPILDADREKHGQAAITSRERAIPMHRLGRPEEVANAILFLASDEASFITGAELVVDGGLTAR